MTAAAASTKRRRTPEAKGVRRASTKQTVRSAKPSKRLQRASATRRAKRGDKRVLRAAARGRIHRPSRRRRVRRIVWNPVFPGSREMLIRQNVQLDQLELPRIANEEELLLLEEQQQLVPVEDSRYLTVASNLTESRRYCRLWTRDFLEDLSEAFYNKFHKPILVTSLVRTIEQQRRLRRTNGNAAPQEGETASTHLTGVTVDILKRGMSRKQLDWLNQYFMPLKQAGLIDPIEERRQPVFHVVVFKTYSESDDQDETVTPPDPLTIASSN